MNPEGAIAEFENRQDANKAGYNTPLTKSEARELFPRNRHERRAYLAQLRKQKAKQRQPEKHKANAS